MDYKELIDGLRDLHENYISEFCADDTMNCDDLCDGRCKDCIILQAITAIETLLAEREAAGWISVNDSLPEFYDWVLVAVESVAGSTWIATAYRNRLVKGGDWFWWWFGYPSSIGDVTYWMPLPTPPDRERTER